MSNMKEAQEYANEVFASALVTLLWSEVISIPEEEPVDEWMRDLDGRPFDDHFYTDDIDGETDTFREQIAVFVTSNWQDLQWLDAGGVGHNFVLSRNGHGTGFWDRGLGELGARLHRASQSYGEVYLTLGDDERVYLTA